MLRGLAQSVLVGAIERGVGGRNTGTPAGGAISTTLLTTGVSLMLVRGRRPAGLVLIAAGGMLRWIEIERRNAAKDGVRPRPAPSAGDASAATIPR